MTIHRLSIPSRRPRIGALLGALAGLLTAAGATQATPLTARQRRAFAVPERDHLKPVKHDRYLRSNETELHLFAPHLRGLGGGYVGVGADQNYTLAAMAGSTFVWLMDYDPFVVRLHRIYRALILASPTPAALVATWSKPRAVQALLDKTYRGDPELPHLKWLYRHHWRFLRPYLGWTLKRKRDGHGTTWLSNPAYYARVRTLWREGRIQPLAGDLHGAKVFRGICAAARRLRVPMHIVYLSNAEMYLPYSKAFLANMRAVPHDARSLLVRTVRHPKLPMRGDRWHYNIEPFGSDFVPRLATGLYHRIYNLMRDFYRSPRAVRRRLMRPRGFSRFTRDVITYQAALAKWRAARKRRRHHRRRPPRRAHAHPVP